jgi:hypothetical protein
MGGALLGAALASVPGVAWANDCRRLGRECRRDSQCCSRNCVRRGDEKVCACPEGKSRCGDRCVNLDRNENHCGSCGNRCPEGSECVGGTCDAAPCIDVPTEQPCCRPCCCTCLYFDEAGNDVSSCLGGYPDNSRACFDACDAATPQGFTASSHNLSCPSVPSTFSCVPAVTGSGTTCSGGTPCTSSAG